MASVSVKNDQDLSSIWMGCLGSSLVISVAFGEGQRSLGSIGLWPQAQKDPRNFSQEEVLGELTCLGKARKGGFFQCPTFPWFWQGSGEWQTEGQKCAQ